VDSSHYDRAEDFFVYAKLGVQGKIIDNVLCKVFLPERNTEKPLLKFRPTKEQYSQIIASHEGTFEAEVLGFDNKPEVSLAAPIVYFSKRQTKYWGPDFSESTFDGEPQNLNVIRYVRSNNKSSKTFLTIWLSPNPMLGPGMGKTTHYTGNIEYKRVHQLIFPLSAQITITLDNYFKEKELGKNESKQWSYLVACAELDLPSPNSLDCQSEIIEHLDAFLLVASLGSRTRTGWVGWESSNHKILSEFYRGNFTFPTGVSEPSFDQGLVWLKDFHEFLSVCYPAFLKHPNKKSVQQAIISVVPGRRKVMEESFLSMFAGLEALLLDFRKRENLEFVVPEAEKWGAMKKRIKSNISKTIKPEMTKDQRCYIYHKLEDLNRISLQVAYNKFCDFYKIDLSDLWPLFGGNNVVGLADIRNRLIHGDQSLMQFHDSLWVAEESLRFMLERVLVKILGWPEDKTEVSKDFLNTHSTALKEMSVEQQKLANYFSQTDIQ
jgi:hypothetical protein